MTNYLAAFLVFWSYSVLLCQPGQLDESFNTTGQVITHIENYNVNTSEVLIQQDTKILVCGTGITATNGRDFVVARYTSNGDIDSSFNYSGVHVMDFFGKNDYCHAMALQSDGKILITGITTTLMSERKTVIIRLLDDGTLDESFGIMGIVVNEEDHGAEDPGAVIFQDDGSIIVTGSIHSTTSTPISAIFKYEEDGTPDFTFGENGLAVTIVPEAYNPSFGILQADGKIISGGFLLGNTIESIILRHLADGGIDSSFGANGIVRINYTNEDHFAYSVALQADKKILVVVGITHAGKRDFCVLRFTENGSIDSSFGTNGRVITALSTGSNTAHAVSVQDDQKILLAGFLGTTPSHDFAMARYSSNGSLDSQFGNGGKVVTDLGNDDLAFTMAIQPDKKIVLAGHTIDDAGNNDFALARYWSGLEIVGTSEPIDDFLNIELYPNPSLHEAILKYNLINDQTLTISLYDLSGKLVQLFLENVQKGNGEHEEYLSFNQIIMDGEYILVIENENSILGKIKFMKIQN